MIFDFFGVEPSGSHCLICQQTDCCSIRSLTQSSSSALMTLILYFCPSWAGVIDGSLVFCNDCAPSAPCTVLIHESQATEGRLVRR